MSKQNFSNAYIAASNALAVLREGRSVELQLVGTRPVCVAIDPSRPERVYCGTFDQGLWYSADAGRSWEPVGAGIPHLAVTAVAVNERGVVYAGTEPGSLYRSEDGGRTWQDLAALRALPSAPTWSFPPRPETNHVRWITFDPQAPERVYVAIEAGALVRSLDGGLTWEDRKPGGPYDTHTLVMHPQAPLTLYSAAGDGFFLSEDGGDRWTASTQGIPYHYLWGAAVDPGDPSILVVSAAPSPMHAHTEAAAEATLFRRVGDGVWQQAEGLPQPKGTLISPVAALEPSVFYTISNRGLFRSEDSGQTWAQVPVQWPAGLELKRPNALVLAP
ncbi:hypothetical protein EI42_02912 [Thermosporothrix hazakensis]|jgi:outer membrane protein assembly factor BamB|uniref:Glycosyl hydrolase n=2 Tax=Thermosporothrix TaxID=768650 RepID=A0A326U5H8_THEHA|nr:glycosyl hydrolase [Thermosporothrix hazakensis]PZW29191.1 hypothetical protein EI42_02912 [Thermosporothrix hazakensis]BBH86118.1 glycosyl hydrolase [Thermosporothrix sp. COM3]GCE45457.1 glycosyl hydrolase [Thermosporothrix hazakensis]